MLAELLIPFKAVKIQLNRVGGGDIGLLITLVAKFYNKYSYSMPQYIYITLMMPQQL